MTSRATPSGARVAAAFAPGHITGIFSPDLSARDPRGRGSIGAGVVLELGARALAAWHPGRAGRRIEITSDVRGPLPISEEVAHRLVARRTGRLEVLVQHELPVGQGFGMSGSGALAVALAVSGALGLPEQRAREVAHLSDLFGGGGLGGVASVLGGGLELRERPGIPPFGRVRHFPFPRPVFVVLAGRPLPSPSLLRDPTFLERVAEAASDTLPAVERRPVPSSLFREAERFTDAVGLASPSLRRTIAAFRATGARAAQAMFGQSVAILPQTAAERQRVIRVLERARLPAVEVRAGTRGAHRVARSR